MNKDYGGSDKDPFKKYSDYSNNADLSSKMFPFYWDSPLVKVNPSFSSKVYNSLDKMFGETKQDYAKASKLRSLESSLSENEFTNNFLVKDYVSQVKKVQKGTLKYNISGDSNGLQYSMRLDGNNELKVKYQASKESEVEIFNDSLKISLRYLINASGKVRLLPNLLNGDILSKEDSMKIFEAYKPFLLKSSQFNLYYDAKMAEKAIEEITKDPSWEPKCGDNQGKLFLDGGPDNHA